jgi:hypothetical protein
MLANNNEKRATKKLESSKANYKPIDEKCASCVSKANARKLAFFGQGNCRIEPISLTNGKRGWVKFVSLAYLM